MIENYDPSLALLHDRKNVNYQNKYVHFEDESIESNQLSISTEKTNGKRTV